jgi:hypothetical protein
MVLSRHAVPLLALAIAAPVAAQTESLPSPPQSARNASYRIAARLDPAARAITGRQLITWRNLQDRSTSELWLHLYWNAWRNRRSTWMLADRLRERSSRRGRELRREDWGWIEVDAARLLDGAGGAAADLMPSRRWAAPDDGNPDDRTVLVLALPRPVGPGETVEVELEWRAQVPRTFARTGYRGDHFFLAHWYPAVGVHQADGWNCHQFHPATEFYADYGVYEVELTLPESFVVGATGREVESRRGAEGTVTRRFVQEDVHNFAWTASPDYRVRTARFAAPGLPEVDLRLLIQPEHAGQAERHFRATRAALEHYGRWFGPYPYPQLTVVDPAYESDFDGMEYPALFTAGSHLFSPEGGGSPEGVTVHEAGHQFWYGLVGNNEFEHAWLDEGLNTYATARVMAETYGDLALVERYFRPPGTKLTGFLPVAFRDIRRTRWVQGNRLDRYRQWASADVPGRPTFRYFPPAAAALTYNKTAIWLSTLERHLGWETMQRILSTFFARFSFRHPAPADFFAVASQVAGEDLSWFFDQVWGGSQRFDYAIDSVASFAVEADGFAEGADGTLAYVAEPDGEDEETLPLYRTEVVVRRLGDGVFPVDVLLVFEDGEELRRRWDGRERWQLVVEERAAKLRHAVVDPEQVLQLDLDFTNNSRRREAAGDLAACKWGSKWLIWAQDLLSTFAFFG